MEAITREEKLMDGQTLEPITRKEKILAGEDLDPITREEWFLKEYRGGGGGDITVESLNVTENGTYTAPTGKAYSPVKVELPLSSKTITANGVYSASTDDLAGYDEVTVDVEGYQLKSLPTGAISTIEDGTALPMPSLKVGIEAVQSGSGDPSPTNIRPISGFSAVNVYDVGKNRITSVTEGVELNSATGTTKANSNWYVTDYVRIEYGKTYYLSGTSSSTVCYYDKNKTFTRNTLSSRTITPQEGEYYVRCNSLISEYAEPQIEEGNEATSFSPFGTTYTTTLKDGQGNPLTCYGGELSNVNGVQSLTENKVITVKTVLSSFAQSYGVYYTAFSVSPQAKDTSSLISSHFKQGNLAVGNCYLTGNGSILVAVLPQEYDTPEKANEWLAENKPAFVYELATPQTIPQDNLAISTQDGTNNLWADSGDVIEGSYFEAL